MDIRVVNFKKRVFISSDSYNYIEKDKRHKSVLYLVDSQGKGVSLCNINLDNIIDKGNKINHKISIKMTFNKSK